MKDADVETIALSAGVAETMEKALGGFKRDREKVAVGGLMVAAAAAVQDEWTEDEFASCAKSVFRRYGEYVRDTHGGRHP